MRLHKWPSYEEMSIVSWCGHQVAYIPVPRGGRGCQIIPILGEAT